MRNRYFTQTGIELKVIDGGKCKPAHTPPKINPVTVMAPLVFENKSKNNVLDFFHKQFLKIKA